MTFVQGRGPPPVFHTTLTVPTANNLTLAIDRVPPHRSPAAGTTARRAKPGHLGMPERDDPPPGRSLNKSQSRTFSPTNAGQEYWPGPNLLRSPPIRPRRENHMLLFGPPTAGFLLYLGTCGETQRSCRLWPPDARALVSLRSTGNVGSPILGGPYQFAPTGMCVPSGRFLNILWCFKTWPKRPRGPSTPSPWRRLGWPPPAAKPYRSLEYPNPLPTAPCPFRVFFCRRPKSKSCGLLPEEDSPKVAFKNRPKERFFPRTGARRHGSRPRFFPNNPTAHPCLPDLSNMFIALAGPHPQARRAPPVHDGPRCQPASIEFCAFRALVRGASQATFPAPASASRSRATRSPSPLQVTSPPPCRPHQWRGAGARLAASIRALLEIA